MNLLILILFGVKSTVLQWPAATRGNVSVAGRLVRTNCHTCGVGHVNCCLSLTEASLCHLAAKIQCLNRRSKSMCSQQQSMMEIAQSWAKWQNLPAGLQY